MEAKAVVRYIRISPRKARYVADLIRGKRVEDALNTLSFTTRKASRIVSGVLKSALANAGQNESVDVDTLYVKSILVDEGPMMKRFRPRAMGRAARIRKRTSHITVILDER
ncbi:MAG TPA: 50S ribosomal protein L22 [Thermodesulfobacteriota bacterium]|nr:50S ribosomal protein L22 [Deltaproteobacteria bacterium]HNR14040.1 50S ribosomal protein L22 [Thermodesulfobacteriota bacterium]HNU70644.1 50S ribosomal protein L22 [Thermodesulfobacteriota bacterium]HQO77035.1 50S ribosomal protein L22 [Thermodesulfobacteriota bacterium]